MIREDSRRFPTSSIGNILLAQLVARSDAPDPMEPDLLRKRIEDRLSATGKRRVPVSVAIGKGRDYLSNFLNAEKNSIGMDVLPALASELQCPVEYFLNPDFTLEGEHSQVAPEVLVPVRGYVAATPDARVIFSTGDPLNEFATVPAGATPTSVALWVRGHSMKGFADEGSLIFYEETRTPPTPDMLEQPVVVETEGGLVLVKFLRRGSRRGLYDLESIGAETLRDQRLRWAAHVLSVVPPYAARRIVRRTAA